MEEGEIEVDSITPIGLPDITPQLARESGFLGVVDLLKVANHGRGRNICLIGFITLAGAAAAPSVAQDRANANVSPHLKIIGPVIIFIIDFRNDLAQNCFIPR
jgi:hypothetical protein